MIGANLIRRLINEGFEIHLLLRSNRNRIRLQGLEKYIQVHDGDITDINTVDQAVQAANPSVVYHLASTPFNPPGLAPENHFNVKKY